MTTPDKACPFCGSADLRPVHGDRMESTQCRRCGAMGPPRPIGQEGGPDWNTRPGEGTLGDALGELVRYASTAMQQRAANVAPYQAAILRARQALAHHSAPSPSTHGEG